MLFQLTFIIFSLVNVQCQTDELAVPIECPLIRCAGVCPYGYLKDKNGCPTCQCFDPCCNYICSPGNQCKVEPLLCSSPPCGYNTNCVPCPEPICPKRCLFGYKVDDKGCKSCECEDPCTYHKCLDDEYCVSEPVGCNYDPFCGVHTKCIKKCPEIMCDLYCPHGFELDCNNCPICKCKEFCSDVTCPKYHYCVVIQIFCIRAPCPGPYPFCQRICQDEDLLLNGDNPVRCQVDDECEPGYTCTTIKELDISYCCGTIEPI